MSVGNLQGGNYEVRVNQNSQSAISETLAIAEASSNSVDDNIYAAIEWVEKTSKNEVILHGWRYSDCIVLDQVKIASNNKDTLSVLPIMKQIREHCSMKGMPVSYPVKFDLGSFKTRKKIPSEKIKTAEKLLKSKLDGENWELHRWNEMLKPEIPLHPNYVKALMATESSFNESPPSPAKDHKVIGLMQIMPETVGHLGPRSKDIKDHFIEISLEDARDPSVAIAAATRWLFRKHRLVKGKKKGTTWMDALEEYKGITNQKGTKPVEIRLKLNQFYKKLQERL